MKIKKNPLLGTWEMAESDKPLPRIRKLSPALSACDPKRIMVVDDEGSVRRTFVRVLANALPDLTIDTCENGKKAVEQFSLLRHCLILMDLSMPVMDGIAAFHKILEVSSELACQAPSVVFCTGYDPPCGIRETVAEDPAHCLLRKPVSNATLVEAVRGRLPAG